jgi:hypothetical protein
MMEGELMVGDGEVGLGERPWGRILLSPGFLGLRLVAGGLEGGDDGFYFLAIGGVGIEVKVLW